jgi:PAS domain S-box-containing protein
MDVSRFFDLSPDAMCIAGYDGYFKKVNRGLIDMLGYSEDEFYTKRISEFIYPDDRGITAQHRELILQGKPLVYFENRYVTKMGEIVWFTWTSMPDPDHELVYAIAKNITHRKKMEDDRNILLSNVSLINQDLKRMTYSTTHDLRSPVNNLITAFSLLDITKVQDTETVEILNLLKLASDGLNTTLDTYVDSMIRKANKQIEIDEIYFQKSLDQVLTSLKMLIANSHTDIRGEFDQAPVVKFNKAFLDSIFLNLISNAIKYRRPGVDPEIVLKSRVIENQIELTIADNGLGFDIENHGSRIFGFNQKFNSNEDSKGIGLYLVHSHVTSLGGTIRVDSTLGKGTTFTIVFNN